VLGVVDGIDLVAKEALYHKTCYRSYVRHYESMCEVSPLSECAAMDSLSLEEQIPTDTKDSTQCSISVSLPICE